MAMGLAMLIQDTSAYKIQWEISYSGVYCI